MRLSYMIHLFNMMRKCLYLFVDSTKVVVADDLASLLPHTVLITLSLPFIPYTRTVDNLIPRSDLLGR